MRRLGLVLPVVAVVTVVLAQPAGATYPGKVGLIAYSDSTGQIATMKSDGTGVEVLTSSFVFAEMPQYSANGKWIVFDAYDGVQYDIYKMRQDGTHLTQLTNDAAADFAPSFSPDGKKIVYTPGDSTIWVMNADGTHTHQLSAGPGVAPRYSPDGKKIVYAGGGYTNEINVMKADGSRDHAITSDTFYDAHPDWSPDGKRIAFVSDRSGNLQAWVMNADGSHRIQVTAAPAGVPGGPEFSPNGKRIADWDVTNVVVVRLDGTGYHVVGPATGMSCCVAWQPLPKR